MSSTFSTFQHNHKPQVAARDYCNKHEGMVIDIGFGDSSVIFHMRSVEEGISLGQAIEKAARALAVKSISEHPDHAMIEEILERR